MTKEQEDVKKFMEGVGQPAPSSVTALDESRAKLRIDLILEECEEFAQGLGFSRLHGRCPVNYDPSKYSHVEIADALTDLLYVVYGAAVECGIDLEPIWDEVQKSNMTKLVDGYKREDGKWMKGPSYVPPDIEPLIDRQINPTI